MRAGSAGPSKPPTGLGARPPFHVFERRGMRLLLDVGTHSLVELSPPAHLYLRALEATGDVDVALDAALRLHEPPEVFAMLREIDALRAAGLLARERAVDAEVDTAPAVEGLLRHRARNLMLLVTEACNLRCDYCYEVAAGFHDAARRMTLANARAVVREYFDRAGTRHDLTITFFGGEPLTNFPLVQEVVAFAKGEAARRGKRLGFSITTNGTILTEEIVAFLVEHRFAVMVSFDGVEEAQDAHRRDVAGRGTYHQVVRNARALLAAQRAAGVTPLKVRATMTARHHDRAAIEAAIRALLPGARVAIGASVGTVEGKSERDLVFARDTGLQRNVERAIEEIVAAAEADAPPPSNHVLEALRKTVEFARDKRPGEVALPRLCGVGRNMLAVTPMGDYYPCHRYVGMPAWKLGALADGGPDHGRLEAYYRALHAGFRDHCAHCWMRFKCGGQCPWYLSTSDGRVLPPDADGCDAIRRFEEDVLGLLAFLSKHHAAWARVHVLARAAAAPEGGALS